MISPHLTTKHSQTDTGAFVLWARLVRSNKNPVFLHSLEKRRNYFFGGVDTLTVSRVLPSAVPIKLKSSQAQVIGYVNPKGQKRLRVQVNPGGVSIYL